MQADSSRIWTRNPVSTSYDDNRYRTSIIKLLQLKLQQTLGSLMNFYIGLSFSYKTIFST